jgi:hypothetical protein
MSERGTTGCATRVMRENDVNAPHVDGHGGQDVLHMRSGQAIGAGSSHPHSSYAL